jgi:hypothetical protein
MQIQIGAADGTVTYLNGSSADVSFRIRFGKGVVDTGVQLVHQSAAVLGMSGPAQKLKVQRGNTEGTETDSRFWISGRQGV